MGAPAVRKLTVSALGVTATVDPAKLDDQDLLDLMADANVASYEGDEESSRQLGLTLYAKTRQLLFGSDWPRIKRELRGDDATLSQERANEFLEQVMAQVGALKN